MDDCYLYPFILVCNSVFIVAVKDEAVKLQLDLFLLLSKKFLDLTVHRVSPWFANQPEGKLIQGMRRHPILLTASTRNWTITAIHSTSPIYLRLVGRIELNPPASFVEIGLSRKHSMHGSDLDSTQ